MNKGKVPVEASREDVEAIEEWLKTQPHLPQHMDDMLIRRFLFCCEHSLSVTKTVIDKYFTLRFKAPEIFSNRDPMSPEIQQVFTVVDMIPLPKTTEENYKVFIYRLIDSDADNYYFNNNVKTFFMLADTRIISEFPLTEGEVPIFDVAGTTLRHVTKMVLSTMRKYMAYIQEAHPVRLRQVHVINCFPIVDKLFSIVKPMINPELVKYIHFHVPGSETLYKFIPKDLLPEEYGGKAGPINEIKQEWKKKMEDMREYFIDEEKWKVNEALRPNGSKSAATFINEGSFRSLSID